MRKSIIVLLAALSMSFPAAADAHSPYLTESHARQAILRHERAWWTHKFPHEPVGLTISACWHKSPVAVECTLEWTGAFFEASSEQATFAVNSRATLHQGHVRVTPR